MLRNIRRLEILSVAVFLAALSIQAGEKTALQEHEEVRNAKDATFVIFTTCFPTAQALHAAINSKGQRQMIKAGMAFPLPGLDDANLKALQAALKNLPEGKAPQSNADALIISYREGAAEWKTVQYSRATLPQEASRLLPLLGMPEERPQR
jgi:hypothetical protein